MPTLNIDGRTVTIDDGFLKLSPEQQSATVEEIHKSLPPAYDAEGFNKYIADKYGARPEDVEALKRSMGQTEALKGIPIAGAYLDKVGGYLAAASPMKGGAGGETFSERSANNTAMQTEIAKAYEAAHPTAATIANVIGGTMALGGMGSTVTGARALGIVGGGLGRQALASAASGGVIGAADAAARGSNPVTAGAAGAALGGALPVAGSLVGTALSPIASNMLARINPERYGAGQVARAIMESGQTPQGIAGELRQAAAENQPQYTVADTLGLSGQRMLSGVARQPGEARQLVADTLNARQAGQGGRIANQLATAFQAPETAAQTEARLTAERATEANRNYGAARQSAGSVNVTPAIQVIDQFLQPGVTRIARPQTSIADDSIEALMRRARALLTDGRSQVSRFEEAFRVKQELDNMIDRAPPTAQRVLIPVRNALDNQLATASAPYAAARNRFRQQSQAIEAVGSGRNAAMRGRTEDTIPAFQGLSQPEQVAFRSGYVDPLIAQVQGSAYGVNKARPFTSDAFGAEAGAMAPGSGILGRQLNRENTMFETRNQALGGSMTAQNLADNAALESLPHMLAHAAQGNLMGALRSAFGALSNGLTGNTPAVRRAIAELLLSRNVNSAQVQDLLNQAIRRITAINTASRLSTRALAGGTALQANRQ